MILSVRTPFSWFGERNNLPPEQADSILIDLNLNDRSDNIHSIFHKELDSVFPDIYARCLSTSSKRHD